MALYEIETVLNKKIINKYREEKIKALDVINGELNKTLPLMNEEEENLIKINIYTIYTKSHPKYISFNLNYLSKEKEVRIKATSYKPNKTIKEARYIKINKEDLKDLIKALYKMEEKEFNLQLLTSKERKILNKRKEPYKELSIEEQNIQDLKKYKNPEEIEFKKLTEYAKRSTLLFNKERNGQKLTEKENLELDQYFRLGIWPNMDDEEIAFIKEKTIKGKK